MAAFWASASFCAFDFLVPNTFKLVLVVDIDVVEAAAGAIADGRTTKADVEEENAHNNAKSIEIRVTGDFILALGDGEREISSSRYEFVVRDEIIVFVLCNCGREATPKKKTGT